MWRNIPPQYYRQKICRKCTKSKIPNNWTQIHNTSYRRPQNNTCSPDVGTDNNWKQTCNIPWELWIYQTTKNLPQWLSTKKKLTVLQQNLNCWNDKRHALTNIYNRTDPEIILPNDHSLTDDIYWKYSTILFTKITNEMAYTTNQ